MDAVNGQPGLGVITILSGQQAGHTFPIYKPITTIGREKTNDIVIEDGYISRFHAQLIWQNGSWTIKNNTAAHNKVIVKQQEVQQATLSFGDVVGLGRGPFTFFRLQAVTQAAENTDNDQTGKISTVQAVNSNTPQPIQPIQPIQPVQPMPPQNIPVTPNIVQPIHPTMPPPQVAQPGMTAQSVPLPPVGQPWQSAPLQPAHGSTPLTSTVPPSSPLGGTPVGQSSTNHSETRLFGVPFLEVSTNINSARATHYLNKPINNIGYDPSNEIAIPVRIVSAFHARIVQEGDQWVLEHPHPSRAGTLNGLIYQGQPIAGTARFRKILASGDIFRIGDEDGTLVTLTYYDGKTLPQETLPNIPPIRLDKPVITIGRFPDNDVVLDHPLVSAHHALLQRVESGYSIIDWKSTNHVYVNGSPIHFTHLLQLNDEIRIGPFLYYFSGAQLTGFDGSGKVHIVAQELKKISTQRTVQLGRLGPLRALEFTHSRTDLKETDSSKDMSIDIPGIIKVTTQQIYLLNDISIAIPPRSFVAVVGGSGAGKSTLMEALNGVQPVREGEVLYNGRNYYRNMADFSSQLGYVPQADIVHADLTVERALYYAARMRLLSDYTEAQIQQRINDVLHDVELAHRRKSLIGKLSGGQRKRVSIALELLANPSVFFLDEPTSGLDPSLDLKMMQLLRKLADKGRTVILVTHATNNINGCDFVCFLCQGGRLAYFGPPKDALTYFGKDDFAQIYSELEPTDQNPNIPAEAEARFKMSPDYLRYVEGPLRQPSNIPPNDRQAVVQAARRPKRAHLFKQFVLLTQRYLELLWNDKANLAILLLQAPVIALILVFMIQYLIGSNVFSSTEVVQCNSINYTNPLDINASNNTNSTSTTHAPKPTNSNAGKNKVVDCNQVLHYLQQKSQQTYLRKYYGGDANKAVQDFIVLGAGSDAQKILFIMAFAALMFGCINSVREIVKEGPIYQRERTVNLGIIPYMFSKIAVLGILSLLQSAVLVIIMNIAAHFHQGNYDQGVFFKNNLIILEIYITLALTSLVGAMLGLVVSAIAPNSDRAMSFIPIILIPQVIFSGFLFALNKNLLQGIGAFFAVRWSIAGLGSSIGLNEHALKADSFTYHSTLFSTYDQAEAVRHMWLVWGALCAMIVILALLIALFLKRKDVKVPR